MESKQPSAKQSKTESIAGTEKKKEEEEKKICNLKQKTIIIILGVLCAVVLVVLLGCIAFVLYRKFGDKIDVKINNDTMTKPYQPPPDARKCFSCFVESSDKLGPPFEKCRQGQEVTCLHKWDRCVSTFRWIEERSVYQWAKGCAIPSRELEKCAYRSLDSLTSYFCDKDMCNNDDPSNFCTSPPANTDPLCKIGKK